MSADHANSKASTWAGWILSAIPAAMLLSGGIFASMQSPMVVQGTAHLGYPTSLVLTLGIIEFLSALLYLIPQTAFFGAILLTAYFGGAVASHLRIGESQFFIPVIFGIIVWIGLALRDARFRAYLR
jgi:hypothetical protein